MITKISTSRGKHASFNSNLANIYYSTCGYWKGLSAIKNILTAAKVPEDEIAVTHRGKVSKVWVSEGVEPINCCSDRIGILIKHTVDSGQRTAPIAVS